MKTMNGTGLNKDLEKLIASMSSSERKAVRAALSEQRTQLYDLYLRKLPYEKILAAMSPLHPQGVAQVKSQLTDAVVSELARYRIGQRKGKASQYVWESILLSEAGLQASLLKRVDTYIQAAYQEEDHFELLRLLGLKRDALVKTGQSRENQRHFEEAILHEQVQLRIVNQLIERQSIHAQALLWRHGALFEENPDAVNLRTHLLSLGPGDSMQARLYYYRALLILIRFGKDQVLFENMLYETLEEIEKEIDIKENPTLIKTKVVAWYNIGLFALERKDLERANQVCQQMDVWRKAHHYERTECEERYWALRLLLAYERGVDENMKDILIDIPAFEWKSRGVQTTLQLITAFYASVMCLYVKDFRESLRWLEAIFNLQNPSLYRPVVCQSARLMSLMVHCSLGNNDLLESLALSTKRHLKRYNSWNTFYQHAVTTILNLSNPTSKTEVRVIAQNSLSEIINLCSLFPEVESARFSIYRKWLEQTFID